MPAVLALLASASALAHQVACPDLQEVMVTGVADFAPLRGKLNKSVIPGASVKKPVDAPALVDFEEHIYETSRPLHGASHCEIRASHMKDDAVSLRQASYRCTWSPSAGFAELKRSLAACIVNPAAREEDPDSLHLYVERVVSGEGHNTMLVSAKTIETLATQAMMLNVTRTVCLNCSPGGCDEE